MTPHKQLHRHLPDQGQIGDCWRTCFACLLDMQPAEVPHFVEHCWQNSELGRRNAATWLAPRGLHIVELAYSGELQAVLDFMKTCNPGTYFLLGGNSRNGCGHSVIVCDGEIVWDPSLDDAGIVGPMDDGYYWITFLVPALHMRGAA